MLSMNYKKNIIWALSLSAIISIAIWELCSWYSRWCSQYTYETPALIIIVFSAASFIPLLILYFLREEIFIAWWKFARWYLGFSVALFILIFFADSGGG